MIDFPADIRDHIVPTYRGEVVYECVSCAARHPIEKFAYTCPACGGLLSLRDLAFDTLKGNGGEFWQRLFAYRALAREPAGLAVCTLLDRRVRRLASLPIRYTGFEVPDRFLVGYGLDHREQYRNLPYVAALPEETTGPGQP